MALHGFMCAQFGYENLRDMLGQFKGRADDFASGDSSWYFHVLHPLPHASARDLTATDLARYDANILALSEKLRMTDDLGRSWKPFQYLALLFTERYLDLYFRDAEALMHKLNQYLSEQKRRRRYSEIHDYTSDHISTLAFQSATGSGKTLLLHANILQYQHYLKEYKQLHKLNKIILVTPDEGMSRQHLRELGESGIAAQLFSDQGGAEIFAGGGRPVDVIDIHKFADKKGIKRVTPHSFEENNLVMVDEGHLGVGGNKWRNYREQLAKNGFTFEYSATFNQAVAGGGEDRRRLRYAYGKAILFDYSYKFFYDDGYGKDYKISNLQGGDGDANNYYLLACLLSFYQQCRIYRDKGGQWRDFKIEKPLWVFLGKTVTGGKSAGKTETTSDVVRIVKFLAWALSAQREAVEKIARLISGETGLVDVSGADIFKASFAYIKDQTPQEIYDDLCERVFVGKGQLHISHLTGEDELQLSAGEIPFGVINVGDSTGLYSKLEAVDERPFRLSKNAFSKPLFDRVDQPHSPVTIVIGARKFAAGWNSWRVSTMGLMHVGTGEGPQIIQMFGRGVRLKGYGMSLKRHSAIEGANPDDGDQLKLLETLNIFGLKA
ncbi:MAG: DEAD/DEAH box helicase family protein, partial [Gammaproteobacteria bacterium]